MKVFKIFLSKQWIFTIKTLNGYAVFDRLFYNTCTIEQNKKPLKPLPQLGRFVPHLMMRIGCMILESAEVRQMPYPIPKKIENIF